LFRPKGGENNIDVFLRAKRLLYYLIDKYAMPNFYEKINRKLSDKIDLLFESQKNSIEIRINSEFEKLSIEDSKEKQENDIEEFRKTTEREKFLMQIREDEILKSLCDYNESPTENKIAIEQTVEELEDINKISTSFQNYIKQDLNFEYEESEIDSYLDSLHNQLYKISDIQQYSGYDADTIINRVLIVSHSEFISELINIIRKFWNLKPNEKNETSNTGIYVIKIYCIHCGVNKICLNMDECNNKNRVIEFDFIVNNDTSHLSVLF
jgi:hypothetical protein